MRVKAPGRIRPSAPIRLSEHMRAWAFGAPRDCTPEESARLAADAPDFYKALTAFDRLREHLISTGASCG